MWLSASVNENSLILLDLEVMQVVHEPAALCSQTLYTLAKSTEELV